MGPGLGVRILGAEQFHGQWVILAVRVRVLRKLRRVVAVTLHRD